MPDWPAFPDSADALARLAEHYRLLILSNVHRAGFAGGNQRLRGDFAAIITAEDVGGYKPAENHFRALDTTLAELGVDRADCCTSPRACSTTTSRPTRPASVGVDQSPPRPPRLGRDPSRRKWTYNLEFPLDGRVRHSGRRRQVGYASLSSSPGALTSEGGACGAGAFFPASDFCGP